MQRQRGCGDAGGGRFEHVGHALRSAAPTMSEPFRLEVRLGRERVRIIPIGEVDLATAPILEDSLRELLRVGCEWVRVDLRRVSFMDCTGLSVLVRGSSWATQSGARLDVLSARGQVARLLALTIAPQPPARGEMAAESRSGTLTELTVARRDDPDLVSAVATRRLLTAGELPTGIGQRP